MCKYIRVNRALETEANNNTYTVLYIYKVLTPKQLVKDMGGILLNVCLDGGFYKLH